MAINSNTMSNMSMTISMIMSKNIKDSIIKQNGHDDDNEKSSNSDTRNGGVPGDIYPIEYWANGIKRVRW